MSIVVSSDFDALPYKLPNLSATIGVTTPSNSFASFVTAEEEKVLISLWGYKMYKDYSEGIVVGPPDPKWVKLRDGEEYNDDCSKLNKYKGLKSLLVPYIYSQWLSSTFDNVAGNGVVMPNIENSDVISPATRIIRSWEDYRHQVGAKASIYHNRVIGFNAMPNSMVGFILANKTDYPDWTIEVPEMKNLWDL